MKRPPPKPKTARKLAHLPGPAWSWPPRALTRLCWGPHHWPWQPQRHPTMNQTLQWWQGSGSCCPQGAVSGSPPAVPPLPPQPAACTSCAGNRRPPSRPEGYTRRPSGPPVCTDGLPGSKGLKTIAACDAFPPSAEMPLTDLLTGSPFIKIPLTYLLTYLLTHPLPRCLLITYLPAYLLTNPLSRSAFQAPCSTAQSMLTQLPCAPP
eukprot:1137068-Pelagomonas_calceolata.AAC.5